MDELALLWLLLRGESGDYNGSDEDPNDDGPGCGCLTFIIIAFILVKLLK